MNIRNRHVSLSLNIVAIFLVIILCFAAALTWFNFNKNTDAAIESAGQLMSEISGKTFERLQLVYNPVITLATQAAQIPSISQKPTLMPHPATGLWLSAMESTPQLYSAFIGWEDGDFFQLINYSDQLQKAKPIQGAPDDARFAIRHIFESETNGRIESWRFIDEDRILVGHRVGPAGSYDPRKRPWYKQSEKVEDVVKTDLYIFNSLQAGGITMARRFDGAVPGVFGVDLTLGSISTFLREEEKETDARLLIFSKTGRINAYPDPAKVVRTFRTPRGVVLEPSNIRDLDDPVLDWLGDKVAEDQPSETQSYFYSDNGTDVILKVTPVPPPYGNEEYIAAIMSVNSLVEPLLKIRENSLLFTFVALAIVVPLIFFFSWRISKPLKLLAQETEAIKDFNLEGELNIKSYVDEVYKLGNSIKTMKLALRTFSLYVPKALVQLMISSNITPVRGGVKRELTMMFTDVSDFTTLSDGTDPQKLMLELSDYFEAMSTKIHHNKGTIDKYIGDAIMSFWNAPIDDPDHAKNACLAALGCDQKSRELYEVNSLENKLKFHTRIGLHSGEVVVGNVGSSDRMDYTAIGSAVNMASRLEELNKRYGTSILVSATTAKRAGPEFCFRPVDLALPKGALTPLPIMELMGLIPNSGIDPSLEVSQKDLAFVKDWEIAWKMYLARDWEKAAQAFYEICHKKPDDKVALTLSQRSKEFSLKPPPADWDGVRVYKNK